MTVREIDPRDPADTACRPAIALRDVAGGCEAIVPPRSFLQTPFWAGFKAEHGWVARYFIVDEARFLTVLVRPLARLMSIAYVPLPFDAKPDEITAGDRQTDPSCPSGSQRGSYLSDLSAALKPHLSRSTAFIRFDPQWHTVVPNAHTGPDGQVDGPDNGNACGDTSRDPSPDRYPVYPGKPAVQAASDTQPPDTVILDLTLGEEALLAQMKAKWRYNAKLAEKKGVSIRFLEGEPGATEGVGIFYELYLETAKRDGIAIHSRAYYESLVRRGAGYRPTPFDKPLAVRVYVAEYGDSVLASIITLFCGEEAVYLYGASSSERRNLMPSYALQWRAIRDAAQWGCRRYDFYGIPPTDDPSHPMHGLYRFKTGFGGAIVHRVGSWDIPLRGAAYRIYRLAENLRGFWFKKAVKRLRGIRRSS